MTTPQRDELKPMTGERLKEIEAESLTRKGRCYCVCHSGVSSRPSYVHCKPEHFVEKQDRYAQANAGEIEAWKVIDELLAEIARLRQSVPPGPQCPKCSSKDLDLWYSDSEGIVVECKSCDKGIFSDLELADLAQFFPAPAPVDVRELASLLEAIDTMDSYIRAPQNTPWNNVRHWADVLRKALAHPIPSPQEEL